MMSYVWVECHHYTMRRLIISPKSMISLFCLTKNLLSLCAFLVNLSWLLLEQELERYKRWKGKESIYRHFLPAGIENCRHFKWVQQSTKSSLFCLRIAKADWPKSLTEELVTNTPSSHVDGTTTPESQPGWEEPWGSSHFTLKVDLLAGLNHWQSGIQPLFFLLGRELILFGPEFHCTQWFILTCLCASMSFQLLEGERG